MSRKAAQNDPTRHQFVPGIGYIRHGGPPPAPRPGTFPKSSTRPPDGTKDASIHTLRPPNKGHPQQFRWTAAARAWAPVRMDRGNRMAWTVDHMDASGWAYVGPA